uniref:HPt domain-containing protein n=1 Tax=Haptolina ericina TaxID=156174 RepID=A0A7S3B1B4_9EUKA
MNEMAERFPQIFEDTLFDTLLALAVHDWNVVLLNAHALKSGAAMIGAMQLSSSAEALEGVMRGCVQAGKPVKFGDAEALLCDLAVQSNSNLSVHSSSHDP